MLMECSKKLVLQNEMRELTKAHIRKLHIPKLLESYRIWLNMRRLKVLI